MYMFLGCYLPTYIAAVNHKQTDMMLDHFDYVTTDSNASYMIYVTGPAKINHVSAKKSPIFNVFAVS